jgi:hypothetical protein
MKQILIAFAIVSIFLSTVPCSAGAPKAIGGFELGASIDTCQDLLLMKTALPIRYQEFLREVEIKNIPGFKSGLIAYGDCVNKGRIVRIKLKYQDGSKKFYENLLRRYKKQFGDPDEWRGDPFHIVLAWKWSFADGDGNRISLILSHNTMDTEEKIGNAVKMTMTNLIDDEARCFEAAHPNYRKTAPGRVGSGKTDASWDLFVPR